VFLGVVAVGGRKPYRFGQQSNQVAAFPSPDRGVVRCASSVAILAGQIEHA
jgi:hypothetical protein